MQFHEYRTCYERCHGVSSLSVQDWYNVAAMKLDEAFPDKSQKWFKGMSLLKAEVDWYGEMRPYFKAWPAILNALCKIKLDLDLKTLDMAPRIVLIRMPIGHELSTGKSRLRSCLANVTKTSIGSTIEWTDAAGNERGSATQVIRFEDYRSIEETLDPARIVMESAFDKTEAIEMQALAWRVSLTCLLLADDPSIITPDVLAKDRDRYNSETDEAWKQRAVDRARRRGVVGWNIGADYEVCPHYRRPHLGLRHTGKGRTVPRIVPIKGAVVHRSRLTEVPTGWLTPDGREIEPARP